MKRSKSAPSNRVSLFVVPVALVLVVAVVLLMQSGAPHTIVDTAAISAISPADYVSQYIQTNTEHFLIDVRTAEEYATGHIANSVNIALDSISARLNEIPRDQPIVLYCRSGNRSAQAAQILAEAGYTNIHDLGGIIDWAAQGYPVQ